MIRRINGTVLETGIAHVIIDVQGIGYLVHTTSKLGVECNVPIVLHTHLAIRENAHDLYGFATATELSFFELLLTLPKVGPKTALAILSQADPDLIKMATLSQDPDHLSKLSGMSKKTAEKITLGLKDKFDDFVEDAKTNGSEHTSLSRDAIDALIALGYPQADARKVVGQIQTERTDHTRATDIVTQALKKLGSV